MTKSRLILKNIDVYVFSFLYLGTYHIIIYYSIFCPFLLFFFKFNFEPHYILKSQYCL